MGRDWTDRMSDLDSSARGRNDSTDREPSDQDSIDHHSSDSRARGSIHHRPNDSSARGSIDHRPSDSSDRDSIDFRPNHSSARGSIDYRPSDSRACGSIDYRPNYSSVRDSTDLADPSLRRSIRREMDRAPAGRKLVPGSIVFERRMACSDFYEEAEAHDASRSDHITDPGELVLSWTQVLAYTPARRARTRRIATSAGDTPAIRLACAIVAGFQRISFSRASWEMPIRSSCQRLSGSRRSSMAADRDAVTFCRSM